MHINIDAKNFVIIETGSFASVSSLASHAIAKGYKVHLIVTRAAPSKFIKEWNKECNVIFCDNWHYSNLELLIMQNIPDNIAAITCIVGVYNGHELLAVQVARLARKYGLIHNNEEAIVIANNKYLMRQKLDEHGVNNKRFGLLTNVDDLVEVAEHVTYPIILKPFAGMASSFISKCDDQNKLLEKYNNYIENCHTGYYFKKFYSHSYVFNGEEIFFDARKHVLLEQAILGNEFSVECICTNDKVYPIIIHDKIDLNRAEYCSYENLLVTPPVRLTKQEQDIVKAYAVEAIAALGIKNCICHVELIVDKDDNKPYVIEVNPRIGGMRVKDSIEAITGINVAALMFDLALGQYVHGSSSSYEFDGYYAMAAIYPKVSGIIRAIDGIDQSNRISGVINVAAYYPLGMAVGGSYEEMFVVDAWFYAKSIQEIIDIDNKIKSNVQITIK